MDANGNAANTFVYVNGNKNIPSNVGQGALAAAFDQIHGFSKTEVIRSAD